MILERSEVYVINRSIYQSFEPQKDWPVHHEACTRKLHRQVTLRKLKLLLLSCCNFVA